MTSITPKWVKDKRAEAGMTQEEFGHFLKVSRFAVSGWEKGHHAIPEDLPERIASANIRPAMVDPTEPLTTKTHPECFIGGDWLVYTLAHPRWYNDSPLRHHVPEALKFSPTLISELASHVPPTMEKVVDLFLANWPSVRELEKYPNNGWMYEVNCQAFLRKHGRTDLLHLIPHDPTNDMDASPRKRTSEAVEKDQQTVESIKALTENLFK